MTRRNYTEEGYLRYLHETLFCANLAFAFALASILILTRNSILQIGKGNSADGFRQVLTRINLVFHLNSLDPLGTDVLLVGLTALFFALLLILVRLVVKTHAADFILDSVAGVAAIAAVPVAWFSYEARTGAYFAGDLRLWYVPVLELAILASAIYLTRKQPILTRLLLLVGHYGVWAWILWHGPWDPFFWPQSTMPLASGLPIYLSALGPCSGLVWAIYANYRRSVAK
jgi:hypothetical protein